MPRSLVGIEHHSRATNVQPRAFRVARLLARSGEVSLLPARVAGELVHRFHREKQTRRAFPAGQLEAPAIRRWRPVARHSPLRSIEHADDLDELRDQSRPLVRRGESIRHKAPDSVKPRHRLVVRAHRVSRAAIGRDPARDEAGRAAHGREKHQPVHEPACLRAIRLIARELPAIAHRVEIKPVEHRPVLDRHAPRKRARFHLAALLRRRPRIRAVERGVIEHDIVRIDEAPPDLRVRTLGRASRIGVHFSKGVRGDREDRCSAGDGPGTGLNA